MFLSAEKAGRLISPYVGLDPFDNNKERVYKILTLVNDKIWNEGSWWGMNAEFFVKTRKGPNGENYIVCPPNYDILKVVNINSKPVLPRDNWFQFHKNASGTINTKCGNWTDSVVDMGEFPVINDIWNCTNNRPPKILIGGCLTGKESASDAMLRIQGEWDRGGEVFTYEKEKLPDNRIEFLNEEEKYSPVFGAKIALNDKIRFIENIWWRRISSIHKNITANPVEVYAFHTDQTLQLLATIPPHATESKHRRYLVPDDACKKSCSCSKSCDCAPVVHAIFKVSEPEEIVYDTQPIYTTSREALISLAIGIDEFFTRKEPNKSVPFTLNGIKSLDDHNREKQSEDINPIQVVGSYMDDVPNILRYLDY